MLNADTLLYVFETCDLASAIALSQTCSSFYELFKGLDTTVVRDKVLERVPWFKLGDSETETWRECALIIAARSKQGLDPQNEHFYLLKDLKVVCSLGCKDVEMKVFTNFEMRCNDHIRKQMTLVFPDGEADAAADDYAILRGSDYIVPGKRKLDLKSMIMGYADMEVGGDPYNYSQWPNKAVSPSGLVVCHESEESFVRIMNENDHLLHVRFRTSQGAVADTLIYKDPNYTGEYVLTSEISPMFLAPDVDEGMDVGDPSQVDGSLVSLLPGTGGALVITSCTEQPHRQLLAYVEPNSSLHTVLICTVPPSRRYAEGYSEYDTRFYTTYDGYLFLYYDTYLIRLWVDLGYRSKLAISTSKIDELLFRHVSERCLTVWDRRFPTIGGFDLIVTTERGIRISQGNGNGMDRYVRTAATCGLGFGDLKTGKTYISSVASELSVTVPFIWKGEFRFGGLGEHVSWRLLHMANTSEPGEDLNFMFNNFCTTSREQKLDGFHRIKKAEDQDPPKPASRFVRHFDREREARDDAADYKEAPRLYDYILRSLPAVALNSTLLNSADKLRII